MLTDRQQKIYDKITISSKSKTISRKEKHFLTKALKNIDDGRRFQDSLNAMNLSLKIYQENTDKPLDKSVKEIYDEIVKIYGEPDFRQLASMKHKGQYGSTFGNQGWLP